MKRSLLLVLLLLPAACREEAHRLPGEGEPLAAIPVAPFAMGRPDVVLLVTGATNGRLEICSCCGVMPGGLSRRSGVFRSYEALAPRTLRIDTGDAFWVQPLDVRNDFLLRGYRMLGYDVMVLGDQEWGGGPAHLSRLLEAGPMAYLSTTVRPAEGQPSVPIQPAVRKEWGDLKLAFVSDAPRDSTYVPPEQAAKVAFAPEGSCARAAAELKAQGYVVVLVSHARQEAVDRVAQAARPDLILRGHVAKSDGNVLEAAGRPVIQVGGADFVGVVAMKVSAGRIAALEYRLEPVGEKWPIDERMVRLYNAYTHAAAVQALDAERAGPVQYVPSSQCGQCHPKQYEFWKGTEHARAVASLVREKRQDDTDCLICHTTGLGLAGGFQSLHKTPEMANVNCQDCHRLDVSEHTQPGFRRQSVPMAVCDTCHTPLTNPSIEMLYEEMRQRVSCPRN